MHLVGKIGIVLFIFENKEDREISHFNTNSKHHGNCQFSLKLIKALTYFQFISIRRCTKMPMLSTLCITEKLELCCQSCVSLDEHVS